MESSFESEDVNFSKDEIVDGAIYRVELKKIRYDFSFDKSEQDGDSRARLRWKLEERKTIKMGTLSKLVESMCLPNGELDTTFLDVLLTTYPSFTTTSLLLTTIIKRFETIAEDETTNPQKESCKRSIRHALLLWLAKFGSDFYDPLSFEAIFSLCHFASDHFPGSDLSSAVEEKLGSFLKSNDETSCSSPVESLGSEMVIEMIDRVSSAHVPILIPPLDIFLIPSSYFAEQLTYVDSNLFCGVVPRHCLGSVWSRRNDKKLPNSSRPVSVLVTIEQFNAVSYRVISVILKWPYAGLSCRTAIIEKWISIAQECRKLKNFSSLKAILAGLQSNPIFRLKKVWQALSKEKLDTFKELAAIFSEDDNQAMWREILYKEGTAKNADVETTSSCSKPTSGRTPGNKMLLFGNKRSTNAEVSSAAAPRTSSRVQGTVPYLGTFLTDLTMLDTAFPDIDTETSMINFDKKRREFEILAQIQILQSTCNLYNILPDPSFLDWFYGIRTYDENESHELSLEIEPSQDTMTKEKIRGHKKNISLGYFTVKKNFMPGDDISLDMTSADMRSTQSLKEMPALSKILSTQLDTLSFISTRTTMSDLTHRRTTSNLLEGSDQIRAKVELVCDQSHSTNFYKSILVSNKDHVSDVLKKVLTKFSITANPDDFCLSQRLENNTEIDLPNRGNVFYAIKTSREVYLVVRPKGQGRRKSKTRSRNASALPWNRTKEKASSKMTRLFNSMVSLVPS